MSCAMHSPCISQSPQINILEEIAAKTRQRIAKERQEVSDSELEQQAYEIAQKELAQEGAFIFPFEKALAKPNVSFICEVKKASPSKGIIAQEFDYLEIAQSYEKAGADAISCLTEPYYFLGSNEYLKEIAKTVSIPLLRKDFTVDARMIYEAKVLGASAVLLICALLNDEELKCFLTLSHNLGLSALVEAHDASEIKRALAAGARIIGVNNRNLVNFEVDTKNSMRLRKYAGNNVLFVSESGIKTRSDVTQLETLGVDALLVGEALMKSARKDEKLADLRGRETLPKTEPHSKTAPLPKARLSDKCTNAAPCSDNETGSNSFNSCAREAFCASPRTNDFVFSNRFDPQAIMQRRKKLRALFKDATLQAKVVTSTTDSNQSKGIHNISYLKACGMTRAEDIDAVNENHPDFCGFVIECPRSKRSVSEQQQKALVERLDPDIFAVGVFVDAPLELIERLAKEGSIDAAQLHGNESEAYLDALRSRCDLPLIKAFQLKTNANASSAVCTSDASDATTIKKVLSDAYASSADMILVDSGAGSGIPFRWSALANFNRPYFLAGGLTPETIPEAFAQLHPWGIDMSSGLETDGLKDKTKIAAAVLAIKNSQQLPSTKGEPLMTNGRFGIHGGQYIPETLMNAIIELDEAYTHFKDDPAFKAELQQLLNDYAGRPSRLYFAQRMTKDLGGAKIYLKREDLNHTGAHKINNVLGQALLAKKMGKTRLIAETGAGQHGVATATAAALLDMECVVYMGREDTERQALNVYKMRLLGAEVRPVDSGTGTLKDAVSETFREWTSRIDDTHYCLGSCMGPHPFPTIVRDFQAVISAEIKDQMKELEGKLPDVVMACVGGGSNAIGSFYHFIQHPEVRLIGCEAAGRGVDTFETAATIATGKLGIFHGMKSYFCQDEQGQIAPVYSISAGLDYPGIGPEHAALHDAGRAEYVAITDEEAVDAFEYLSRLEGIIPAIESAHAVAYARKLAPTMSPDQSIVITLSGRGDKDCAAIARYRGENLYE